MRPFVRSYGDISTETLSLFMILMRLRRSLPAIVARTVFPTSSSIENIPALNFSITLPITSIASSFGNLFLYRQTRTGRGTFCAAPPFRIQALPAALPRPAAVPAISAAPRAFALRPRFVDVQRSAIDVFAVQAVDCSVPFGIHAHFDKRETPGLSRLAVRDNVHTVNRSVRRKHGTHRIFGGPETQVTYKNVLQFGLLSEFAEQRTGKIRQGRCFEPSDVGTCAISGTGKDIIIVAQFDHPQSYYAGISGYFGDRLRNSRSPARSASHPPSPGIELAVDFPMARIPGTIRTEDTYRMAALRPGGLPPGWG